MASELRENKTKLEKIREERLKNEALQIQIPSRIALLYLYP